MPDGDKFRNLHKKKERERERESYQYLTKKTGKNNSVLMRLQGACLRKYAARKTITINNNGFLPVSCASVMPCLFQQPFSVRLFCFGRPKATYYCKQPGTASVSFHHKLVLLPNITPRRQSPTNKQTKAVLIN